MSTFGESKKTVDYEKDIDKDQVRQRIIVNRIRMMSEEPFYANMAMNLRLQEVDNDHTVKSISTDGRTLIYNPWFMDALDNDEQVFAICHVVMHLVLRHPTRIGKKDDETFWQAGDFIINGILVRDGIGRFPDVGGLYNEDYTNKTTEYVYDELKQKKQNSGGSGGGSGNGDGIGQNFDQHMNFEVGEGDSDDPNTVRMTEDEMTQLDNEIQAQIMQAAQVANSIGAGNMPAEIERMISDLTEPRMNWRDVLRENAKAQVRSDYSWKTPNRRLMYSGIIIPGVTVDDHYDFVVGLDASGSMSEEQLKDFISEIYFIADCFQSFKLGLFTFDTKAYNYQEFTQENMEDLLDYRPKGGGGTDFMCAFDYMKELDLQPQTFIMLTDGLPWNSWGDPDFCETIFLIHDKNSIANKVKAPFGTTLYYDDYL